MSPRPVQRLLLESIALVAAATAAAMAGAAGLAVQAQEGGPINRFRVVVPSTVGNAATPSLVCVYADGTRYRCAWREVAGTPAQAAHVVVDVPDLGRGLAVQLLWSRGAVLDSTQVALRNPATLFHEIETVPLPAASGLVDPLRRERVTTLPAAASPGAATARGCDSLQAQWEAAVASDPLFVGPSGRLPGTVLPDPPVKAGSAVEAGNPSRWLLTFPASATRAQFIVRYAIVYRVGLCAERLVSSAVAAGAAAR
jgi:hypothetical protein